MREPGGRLRSKEACMRHILILSLVAAAACGPSQSEVEVDWTFAGASCDQAGVAPDGSITHQATQTIQVRGGHRNLFTIDVPLIASAPETPGSATLTWTFDGKSCAAATVD